VSKHGQDGRATNVAPASDLGRTTLGVTVPYGHVWRCAVSIQAHRIFYYSSRGVSDRISGVFKFTLEVIDGIARHAAELFLAGIRALGTGK
jgi:hypothetical protein